MALDDGSQNRISSPSRNSAKYNQSLSSPPDLLSKTRKAIRRRKARAKNARLLAERHPVGISVFPNEIPEKIVKLLDPVTKVCFALTNTFHHDYIVTTTGLALKRICPKMYWAWIPGHERRVREDNWEYFELMRLIGRYRNRCVIWKKEQAEAAPEQDGGWGDRVGMGLSVVVVVTISITAMIL